MCSSSSSLPNTSNITKNPNKNITMQYSVIAALLLSLASSSVASFTVSTDRLSGCVNGSWKTNVKNAAGDTVCSGACKSATDGCTANCISGYSVFINSQMTDVTFKGPAQSCTFGVTTNLDTISCCVYTPDGACQEYSTESTFDVTHEC